MILKFNDIGDLAIRNYDFHMRKFGGNIHHVTLMQLILLCVAVNEGEGKGKETYLQLKAFLEDLGVRYGER